MDIQSIINDPNATIIDVREPFEFAGRNAEGSINIPLGTVAARFEEIKAMPKPLVFCCASGNRSGMAAQYFQNQGVSEAYNGGSWAMVDAVKVKAA
jgi:phage shock protein E